MQTRFSTPRFSLLPLVSGPPSLRFYAGTPLLTPEGAALGTLCLLDVRPRKFCRKKQDMLKDLAASVVSELELRRIQLASEETETLHRQMFSENPYPMWVFDAETLRFLDVNETALALYGYTRAEFLALSVLDLQPAEERSHVQAYLEKRAALRLSQRQARHLAASDPQRAGRFGRKSRRTRFGMADGMHSWQSRGT